jgi:hypothetical protein
VPPGRIQIAFEELGPDIGTLFEGKDLGAIIELPDKTSIHLIGLFEPNPNPPKKAEAAEVQTTTGVETE